MSDVITRFKLETTQYDSKLRDSVKGLKEVVKTAELAGKDFKGFEKNTLEAAKALGTIETGANNSKDKVKELVGAFNEMAKTYNTMSKDIREGDVGKALAESLTQLSGRIKEAKQELYSLGDSAKGGGLFSGLSDKMSGAIQVFAGNMMTKAAGAVANLGSEMVDMVQQGVELAKQGEGIRIAFERLGRGDILNGLREATHGTVTDLELMKAAVKFNDFKLPVEELGTMLAFAQQKAKDTGQSVDYMVDSIVTGLGRKSLMILDNLGLSAAEIKEKMAETGDMTKAVGEIIREQMSKAGDYVETAADRAARANVNLQNKMEELGRKFAPLQEASNNLWTSMKISIMDLIGGPLTNFINKLTEAGRIAQQYGVLGGNSKVGRLTTNLINAREGNRQSIYQQQQEQFWRYITPREQQIKDIRAWQRGERGEALQSRINAITEKYGSLDATKIQAEVDAAKKMLADYQQAAKTILAPVEANISTNDAINNVESLKVKLAELEAQRKKAIAAGDTELSKNLLKQINQTKADIRGLDPNALKNGGSSKNLPDYLDFYKQALKSGGVKNEIEHISPFEMFKNQAKFDPENILGSKEVWESYKDTITGSIGSIGESMNNLTNWTPNFDPYKDSMDNMTESLKQQKMAFGLAAQAAQGFGAALSGIEDPAAKAAGTVVSAIASIALGFAMASSNANTAGTGWGWLAWLAAGTAAMATTISTIHSLTGYQNGGMIKGYSTGGTIQGNSYSGDNIGGMVDGSQLVGLNAGELVLNKAQQATLAQNLQGNGGGVMRVVGEIQGEKIVLVANRYFKRTGQGEIVTW